MLWERQAASRIKVPFMYLQCMIRIAQKEGDFPLCRGGKDVHGNERGISSHGWKGEFTLGL